MYKDTNYGDYRDYEERARLNTELPPDDRPSRASLEEALAAERAKVRELVEALAWYVREDNVEVEDMEGNEFWVEGKRKAEALIEKYSKEEPNNE